MFDKIAKNRGYIVKKWHKMSKNRLKHTFPLEYVWFV